MNQDESLNDPAIQLALNANRTITAERANSRSSRIPIGLRGAIVLLVLAAVIVVIGAMVLSHIDTREFIRLDILSQSWS